MTRYIASLIYNTSRSSRDPRSYRISLWPDDTANPWVCETGRLIDIPPVLNNLSYARGCFDSWHAALGALLQAIDTPCVIRDNPDYHSVRVMRPGVKSPLRVLARRGAKRDFIEAE